MIYLSILLVQVFSFDIACNLHECPPAIQGDAKCDVNCMNPYCGFDSGGFFRNYSDYQTSDCFDQCMNVYCSKEIGDISRCGASYCNVPLCGYNFGGCGFCPSECYDDFRICDLDCNATSCFWSPWLCEDCSRYGCNSSIWGNGVCDKECENPECKFDNFDCLNSTCAPGCYTWMVNNSICDETCYVKECNYDGFDCDCAPGCFDDLLYNQECDEACNNKACNFDNGNCGYCVKGCFLEMLWNDVCDEACDNHDCKYDFYACKCTESCLAEDYGKCKPECLVSDCQYDQISTNPDKRCSHKDIVLFSLYQQSIIINWSCPVSFDDCSLASNYKCTLKMAMNYSACYNECYFSKCNYGLCGFDTGCKTMPEDGRNLCIYCKFNSSYVSGLVKGYSSYYTLFGIRTANINSYSYTAIDFYIYHAMSIQKGTSPSGSGSILFPFETLGYALKSIKDLSIKNVVLFLKNDGNYTLTDLSVLSELRDFTLTAYDENKVTVKVNGWANVNCTFSFNGRFKNIIFDGSGQHVTCNDSEYCEYCSYNTYNDTDKYYYNDRSEPVSKNLPVGNCNDSQSTYLSFLRLKNAQFTMQNVEFKNWRFNYDSIISGSGKLWLFNVSFDNIKLKAQEKNAIIYNSGLNIIYIGGSVTRLNNGYEFIDPIDFRGFLYSSNYSSSILIKNVEFKYNLIYLKPKSSLSSASLIYINKIQDIEIENCTFLYNYCEKGLFFLEMDVNDYGTYRNESFFLPYLTLTHIFIHDSNFISNYGDLGLIHINFLGKLINVNLKNLAFESNGAKSGSIIFINNPQILDEYKTQTKSTIVMTTFSIISVILSPRWCKMTNITFKDNHAQGIIKAINLVNFDLKELYLDSNGSPNDDKNINTLLLDYFIKNREIENLYISKPMDNSDAIDCNYMVSISNSYNLDITPLSILNNICRNSSPTYIVYNSTILDFSSVSCIGNIGNGHLPVCFYFTGIFDRNMTDSNFTGNKNMYISGNGVIKIENENNLYITNCTFNSNSASLSPAVHFSGQNAYIDSCIFEENESRLGNGGGINFFLASLNYKGSFIVSSSNFVKNSAHANGGGIFIEASSTTLLGLDFIITQTNFTKNYAAYGSALYVDDSISLSLSSTIISSIFKENYSKISGTISLYYYGGILSFRLCDFIENVSNLGAVFHIDITQDSISLRSKVIIELSNLRSNTGESIINVYNQNRNSTVETKNCSFEYNNGTVVSLNLDYFSDHGSIFQHNSAPYGSCFFLQNSAILYASSQFLNNTSEKYGGVIVLSFKSIFHCDDCTFIQNRAINGTGGVLDAEPESQFLISNSKFLQNSSGKDGSAIFAINCNATMSYITHTQFEENYAEGSGLITLLSSKIAIISSNVINNSAKGYASGIKLILSYADISNSTFDSQKSISGSFIYLFSQSTLNIQNSTLNKGSSLETGGAIYLSSSTLSINSSYFSQLYSLKGGAIYATFDSTISLKNSEFYDLVGISAGGIISADQTTILIENSIFSGFSSSGIYGTQLKNLEIKNSFFSNGVGTSGGAIHCESCSYISIDLSNFVNNSASFYGGALFFTATGKIEDINYVSECRFENNIAQNGGAIWISNTGINISNSIFKKNKAISNTNFVDNKIEYGLGGGIRISCPSNKNCKFIVQQTSFSGNIAAFNGGAISWDDKVPEFYNNHYTDNSAEYGQDIASYPIKLMQVKADGSLSGYKRRNLNTPISDFNITAVASGQNIKTPLLVALVDDMNSIIKTDNFSQAELRALNSSTQISGATKVTAVKGIFNFSEFIISEEPGSDIQIMIISSAIDTNKIKKSGETFYSQALAFDISMRQCEIGEVKSGKNCEVCPEGFYSLNPNLISCLACPESAECYGNYTMTPLPGYWRENMYTDLFWKCPRVKACLGSPDKNNISYTGLCEKGYKGNKCQSCEIGYSHTTSNKCEKCPAIKANIFLIAGITISLLTLSSIIVKITRKSAFKPKSHASVYIKIFLNYIQMAILASTFKLNWPEEVLGFFKFQTSTDYVYQQIYSFQCLLTSEGSASLIYFRTLTIIALIPFLMLFLSLLFWLIFKLVKSSYFTFWDDFISTCIVLLFLIHPSIVKKMFASMNCTEINNGEYWLEEDLDIRCWNRDHIFYILTVSLPTIALWGVILPTICLIKIIRNKNKLNNIDVRLTYGFLFNGFKEKHFYWEFIILYSKIILICCSVFLAKISLKLQALIVAILYTIFLHLQYSNNPYTDIKLNQMELRAKLVCVVTIYSGLYYLMGSLNKGANYFFYALMVIVNLFFLVHWAFYLFKSVFATLIRNFRYWRNKNSTRIEVDENATSVKYLESHTLQKVNVSAASSENLLIDQFSISSENQSYHNEESQVEISENKL